MDNHLMMMHWGRTRGKGPLLPAGYTQCAAIRRIYDTGTLDTNLLIAAGDEWTVEAANKLDANRAPVGTSYSKTDSNFSLWLDRTTGSAQFNFGNGGSDSYKVIVYGYDLSAMHEYRMKLSTGEAWIDGTYAGKASSVGGVSNPRKLILFGCGRGSDTAYSTFYGDIGRFSVARNGAFIRKFVPCVRESDRATGFYDIMGSTDGEGGTSFYAFSGKPIYLLPSGYRPVEYIQSTGTQYIDAGFNVRASFSAVIDQDLDFSGLGVRNFTAGNYRPNGTGGRMINAEYTASNYARIWQHSTANIVGNIALTSTRHVYTTQIDSNVTMKVDDAVMAQMARYIHSNYATYAFKLFTDGRAGTYGGQKHYFTRATVNGTMVRLMVPCVRTSDSKPGLYDLCGSICSLTDTPFYINSGTGSDFTWGELN